MPQDGAKSSARDAERSREAILDAAEKLFANKGFEQTSLQEIGQLAGVSRGTPNYFFGTKEQLYGAVLDRVIEAEHAFVIQTLPLLTLPENKPEEVLAQATGYFLDFLVARPTFIRLIEREALNNAHFLRSRSAYLSVMTEGVALAQAGLSGKNTRPIDPVQLLISIIALCWFPLAHADTFLQPLGIDANDAAFWATRKQHIIDLVMNGMLK